jgi:hypothetical protein
MRGIVLIAAILRRIVRGRDDHAVSVVFFGSSSGVGQDRMGDDRRWRVVAALIHHDVDSVRGEHLDGATKRRFCVRVDSNEQRTFQTSFTTIVAKCLSGRQDMIFIERGPQRRTSTTGSAERDTLG